MKLFADIINIDKFTIINEKKRSIENNELKQLMPLVIAQDIDVSIENDILCITVTKKIRRIVEFFSAKLLAHFNCRNIKWTMEK